MTTTTDPDETSTYLYETTVGLRRRGTVERQQRALCVQREDSAAKVTVTYMGETGLGTQLNIDIPADEIPAMVKALIATAGLSDPFDKDHDELRDKRTDLLNIRGILSPQDRPLGLGPVVPMPLGKEVAPAVEWLVNEVDQLREENLHLRGVKSAPDVWSDARLLTDDERAFQDGI